MPTPADLTKHYYLSANPVSGGGDGTEDNPYDCSTATLLDGMFLTFQTQIVTPAVIHFGVGTFYTNGAVYGSPNLPGINVKGGYVLQGSGREQTVIRLSNNVIDNTTGHMRRDVILSLDDTTGVHVSDLTVDGNRANQPAYTGGLGTCQLYAVNLFGHDCSIRRVRVVNTFNTGGAECFPVTCISSSGTWANPAVGILEEIEVDDHRGGSTVLNLIGAYTDLTATVVTGTASTSNVINFPGHTLSEGDTIYFTEKTGGSGIDVQTKYFVRNPDHTAGTFQLSLFPADPILPLVTNISAGRLYKQSWVTGRVTGCRVWSNPFDPSGTYYSKEQGLGAGGWADVDIHDNVFDGLFSGIYIDTNSNEGAKIHDNFIRVRANPSGYASFGIAFQGGFSWKDWDIYDNDFVVSVNSNAIRTGAVAAGVSKGVSIHHNTFRGDETTSGATVYAISIDSAVADARITDNRFEPGLLINIPSRPGKITFIAGNRTTNGAKIAALPDAYLGADTVYAKPSIAARADAAAAGGTQSFANAARDFFDFDTVRFDGSGASALMSTSNNRATAPVAGYMRINFVAKFASVAAVGYAQVEIIKNGVDILIFKTIQTPDASSHSVELLDGCVAGDYYQGSIWNYTGTTMTISQGFGQSMISAEFTPA